MSEPAVADFSVARGRATDPTPVGVETRTCRTCGVPRPLDEFDVRADTGKPKTQCKPCRRDYQNARNARKHPPRDRGPARVADQPAPLRCTRSGELKTAAEFPPVRRGEAKLQTWCRACFAEVNARNYVPYYARERDRITKRQRDHRAEIRRNLVAYLLDHPCVDCGEPDIVVLEFDHIVAKTADVSSYANGGRTWEVVAAELAKCEVRCVNCHRRKTAERRGSASGPVPDVNTRSPNTAERPLQLLLDAALGLRECRVCHVTKGLFDFPFRSTAAQTRHWICRECQRIVARSWYGTNRERHKVNARNGRRRAREAARRFVIAHLLSHPCVDCGESDPGVLDFDHLRDKVTDISSMLQGGSSVPDIAAEIAKCEVRCGNCHRRRTCEQVDSYRIRLTQSRVGEAA